MNYILKKGSFSRFIGSLLKEFEVVAPVSVDGTVKFNIIKKPSDFSTNYTNTWFSPKKFFLPAKEEMFQYKKNKHSFKVDTTKRVILGIRPCDVHALLALDKIFLEETVDPYYEARRVNTVIIALQCAKSGKNCFCESLGTNTLDSGYDLLLQERGDSFIISTGTEIGKSLVKDLKHTQEEINPDVHCVQMLSEDEILKLKSNFYSPVWEEHAKNCLSCCACVHLCPSCGCFNMEDLVELDGKTGTRARTWSSCQLQDFTSVAGGHAFREGRAERLKHRVYHKLDYFKDKFGIHMCTGCGRCITACPASISIVEMVKEL